MNFIDLRLKLIHTFRKYKKIIFIVLSIWAIVIFVNYLLQNTKSVPEPPTTYEPHVSVMNDSSSTPMTLQEPIENMIKSYIDACNSKDYQKAFNIISEDCRKYSFDNNPTKFLEHVLSKIPNKKNYAIQNYSNMTINSRKMYVYEIKYTEDLLATGLTNSEYAYTSEKMTFFKESDGSIKMSVGNYIYHTPIQSISENEYLKIDIIDKVVNYGTEIYQVKFTNRSENTVVVSDGYGGLEIALQLNNETRKRNEQKDIVLAPGGSLTEYFTFEKFADDGDVSRSLNFGSIRVMETYSGTEDIPEEIIQAEIDNAIAKFSMIVSVVEE